MNKGDLINKVAEVLNSKKEAQAAVDCTIKSITGALANKDSVTLVGFGTFKTANRKARKGRNPQTGKEINIPAVDLSYDFNKIYWDGRDEDGDIIANGVYLYKVILTAGDKTEDVIQKLAIVR